MFSSDSRINVKVCEEKMSPKKQKNQYAQIDEIFPNAKWVDYNSKGKIKAIFKLLALALGLIIVNVAIVSGIAYLGTSLTNDIWQNKVPLEISIGDNMSKTNIYAVNSQGDEVLLASFFEQNREPLKPYEIPKVIKEAVVSAEDKNFYNHSGVDLMALIRAARANYTNNEIQQGGSSINQQYIKNVLIQEAEQTGNQEAIDAATETTLKRKINEARMAIYLNRNYTKDEILTGYLNIVSFGGRNYGIKTAANYYFGVDPKDLTLNQATSLIAIVNQPELYRLDKPESENNGAANGYKATKDRRDYILKRMLEDKKISEKEYESTISEPIEPKINPPSTGCESAGGAAFFCDYVTRVILNDPNFGKTYEEREVLLKRGGLQIYTTLNLDVQAAAEAGMAQLPKTSSALELGGSVVTVETKTGKILAMAQNKIFSNNAELASADHSYTSINYNANYIYGGSTGFQTGSTFKLFTLLEWFNQGKKVYDNITNYGRVGKIKDSCNKTGYWEGDYKFKNANGGSYSSGTVYNGTAQSLNTTFIGMATQLDLCNIVKMAEVTGVERADGKPMFSDPAMVIGTNEIAPMAMASAYGTVANGGTYCKPIAITKILNNKGKQIDIPNQDCKEAVNPEITAPINYILKDVAQRGMARPGNPLNGTPLIGKTGTTDDGVDSWLVMSSTNVSTAVWIGNTIGKVSLDAVPEVEPTEVRFQIMKSTMGAATSIYGGDEFPEPREDSLY